jgi:beta-N-acetylglucosaminidase
VLEFLHNLGQLMYSNACVSAKVTEISDLYVVSHALIHAISDLYMVSHALINEISDL